MSKPEYHFFVCINNRPPFAKPSCAPRGGNEILMRLKTEIEERQLTHVRACGSSCLGPCEEGPTVVVYPEGTWYKGVQPEDIAEIVESHVIHNKPVERLLYDWPDDEPLMEGK